MIRPITPQDIAAAKAATIPDFIIKAVNALIADRWNGAFAKVTQKDIVDEALILSPDLSPRNFEYKWLEFEEIYREVGWHVDYDKPGYNESYESVFTFKRA